MISTLLTLTVFFAFKVIGFFAFLIVYVAFVVPVYLPIPLIVTVYVPAFFDLFGHVAS